MAEPDLTDTLTSTELEALHRNVSKALAIAKALSEKPGGDRQDRYAADAIVDYLSAAQRILESREARREIGIPPPAY